MTITKQLTRRTGSNATLTGVFLFMADGKHIKCNRKLSRFCNKIHKAFAFYLDKAVGKINL